MMSSSSTTFVHYIPLRLVLIKLSVKTTYVPLAPPLGPMVGL